MDVDGGHDEPRWLMWLAVVGGLVIAVALAVLRIDLRHTAAVDDGRPLDPYIVTVTPSPYGWPPGR